jgi:hypothetical protein
MAMPPTRRDVRVQQLRAMDPKRWTLAALASRFHVSISTIERDLGVRPDEEPRRKGTGLCREHRCRMPCVACRALKGAEAEGRRI